MTPIQAYVLAKRAAEQTANRISNITLNGTNLIFEFTSGDSITLSIPLPKDGAPGPQGLQGEPGKDGAKGNPGADGISVTSLQIRKDDNHLICTLSDNNTVDAGEIPSPKDTTLYWDTL